MSQYLRDPNHLSPFDALNACSGRASHFSLISPSVPQHLYSNQRRRYFLLGRTRLLLDRFLGCAVGCSSGIARGDHPPNVPPAHFPPPHPIPSPLNVLPSN